MKILMLVILTPLIAAIVLRSKYSFFMPLEDKRFNVYNATSFFLCLATITWATLWFFKSEAPLIDPEIAISEEIERRRRRNEDQNNRNRSRDNAHYTPSLHQYDEEIDYTLPSYFEVPPPPTYIKAISSSNGEVQIEQVENIPLSATESSSQIRNSIIESTVDNYNVTTDIINEANIDRIEDNHAIPRAIHDSTSVNEVTEVNQSTRQ
ncbi:hypothetical protein INT46_011603 [Mucor plumbeus]|uniref:Uncharacterized protein n=1 Tax=Mucor plumbeus TaxID=97098 RepID=A0A8H7UZH6_9FUNG|nr:hypothetical protein INT46_011603 [Mucor plumbeus]